MTHAFVTIRFGEHYRADLNLTQLQLAPAAQWRKLLKLIKADREVNADAIHTLAVWFPEAIAEAKFKTQKDTAKKLEKLYHIFKGEM